MEIYGTINGTQHSKLLICLIYLNCRPHFVKNDTQKYLSVFETSCANLSYNISSGYSPGKMTVQFHCYNISQDRLSEKHVLNYLLLSTKTLRYN